jgi:hypothetical protein
MGRKTAFFLYFTFASSDRFTTVKVTSYSHGFGTFVPSLHMDLATIFVVGLQHSTRATPREPFFLFFSFFIFIFVHFTSLLSIGIFGSWVRQAQYTNTIRRRHRQDSGHRGRILYKIAKDSWLCTFFYGGQVEMNRRFTLQLSYRMGRSRCSNTRASCVLCT